MRTALLIALLAATTLFPAANAAVLWVGNSPACVGSSVHASLDSALFVAALNGDSSDEIRLTRTVSYTGNGNGSYSLQDWSPSGQGALTLAGGYPDCFTAANGKTRVGDSAFTIFEISTSSQQISQVTLRDLLISNSGQRAITASQGATVFLQRVEVSDSNGGIGVSAGAFVGIDGGSLIEDNHLAAANGGGISCAGSNSAVQMAGLMVDNRASNSGGNIYIGGGCFVELLDGARLQGDGPTGFTGAVDGAGIHVASNGQLHARGRTNRVIFEGHRSSNRGGGLHVSGGLAILENVHFDSNRSQTEGSAIAIQDEGQLFMDRTADCPLGGLRCSEIQNSQHDGTVVLVVDSFAQIQRTLIERSTYFGSSSVPTVGIVHGTRSTVRLNRVAIMDNDAYAAIGATAGRLDLSHLTVAGNRHPFTNFNFVSFVNRGNNDTELRLENSLVDDSTGTDWAGGTFAGKCNLIDTTANGVSASVWQAGSFFLGSPSFVNIAGNDPHQTAASIGVDMCQRDTFSWSTEVDLDMQSAPVNESTNPQAMPGEAGGLYDAGFDEVYANVGDDEFTLTVNKTGSGAGVVISNPAGISCGSDCSEVYFNGTIVTLNAAPITGSTFADWFNCPLVNAQNQCLVAMTTSQTVRAEFVITTPEIFSDGFE